MLRGEFREDLLYRLNVVNLHIPPLRERPTDVVALADFFIDKYADANGLPPRRLSDDARAARSSRVLARQCARTRERDAPRRAAGAAEEIAADDIRTPDGRPVPVNAIDATAERAVSAAEGAINGAALRSARPSPRSSRI